MNSSYSISIDKSSIKDQVKAKAYYTGRGRGETSNPEALISEIMETENDYILESSIKKAIGNILTVIGEYAFECDNATENQINLTMPDHFDKQAIAAITQAVHQYCEAKVLNDWFAITSPTDANFYAQQMVLAIADIRNLMRRRLHPVIVADSQTT